jgi:hypothetical protein
MITPIQFGKVYKLYSNEEVKKKEQALKKAGVDYHTQYNSSDGMLCVINWKIYTNEETPDLDTFRRR